MKKLRATEGRPFIETITNYAWCFAGQGTSWLETLRAIGLTPALRSALTEVETRLNPIADVIDAVRPLGFHPEEWARDAELDGEEKWLYDAGISVPAILLTQIAMVDDLREQGIDSPSSMAGHSQGTLGVAYASGKLSAVDSLLLASMIGAAVQRHGHRQGYIPNGEGPTMLAVNGLSHDDVLAVTVSDPNVHVALRNGVDSWVLAGRPRDVSRVHRVIEQRQEAAHREIKEKKRGGSILRSSMKPLPISAGFHVPGNAAAVEDVVQWAEMCGLDVEIAREIAQVVLVDPVDWPAEVERMAGSADWILDLGPSRGVSSLTESLVEGLGIGVLALGTSEGQMQLCDAGESPVAPLPYEVFAPRSVILDGEERISNRWTELTGLSPILLSGMTPTTVDPAIVAAAANAGYWAELAGGGQVTPLILDGNLAKLSGLLEPGVAAKFNAMFLNPAQWRMHIEGQRLVPRARANGTAIDGIVVSAGVPPLEEAVQLVRDLRASGFSWVAMKPGTVQQIRQVLAIADEVPDIPIIMQVEGGKAGGHHSWEDLDDLLLATYGEIRRRANVVVAVGGGIRGPEHAADYLTGVWAHRHDRVAMPVDGVLVGTAAMAALESTASPSVKERLVATRGIDGWAAAGEGGNDIVSGLSQLGADLHEVNNAFAQAGRLLDTVAGDADAVRARREDIIEALSRTAKPYFGDLNTMTYSEWLHRYAELCYPWVDPSWAERFARMVERTEARLSTVDRGEFGALIDAPTDSDPRSIIHAVDDAYPRASTTPLHPADRAWFLHLLDGVGKPAPFVPILDGEIRRWFRQDSLWQAHDPRYDADAVSIIPGIAAVDAIERVDEPIAEILARYEHATVGRLVDSAPERSSEDVLARIIGARGVSWAGRYESALVDRCVGSDAWVIEDDRKSAVHPTGASLRVLDGEHAELSIPLGDGVAFSVRLTVQMRRGRSPIVTREDAEKAMLGVVRAAAGGHLAPILDGEARWSTRLTESKLMDYGMVTGGQEGVVPDALVGLAWPALFAVVADARVPGTDDDLVVEGLFSLVHLEHHLTMRDMPLPSAGAEVEVRARCMGVTDTVIGRVVEVFASIEDRESGRPFAELTERFVIRGRVGEAPAPADADTAFDSVQPTPIIERGRLHVTAPTSMRPFAAASGDHNPIHTSALAARLAGLDDVIVHGMWTSAMGQRAAIVDGATLLEYRAQMLAPVRPGDSIEFIVERSGLDSRAGRGEVRTVRAIVDGEIVLRATAVMAAPRTMYVFPGQGIQSPGMGMEARRRSAAAREVWDRADRHTRAALGFSVLEIVQNNPRQVVVAGERFSHPKGVLHLTQFTQVAMATLGVAQIAEMREAGVLDEEAWFAGHSVGEYNALAAYAGVLSLENVVEIVYRRGLTMHRLVDRDENGRSRYGLAALRPSSMGIAAEDVFDYVAGIASASGEFLEIVNHNIAGHQYAVAGTLDGLAALAADAESRAPGARATIMIPGIDVPFHSSRLRDGVDDFRAHLDSLIPDDIDADVLLGRYIPNLVARPFSVERPFLEEMLRVTDSPIVRSILDGEIADSALVRTVLIELLAWQFASPVRWIETQDLMCREVGIERFVEIGVGSSPTLANLMSKTLSLAEYRNIEMDVMNLERDRLIVFAEDETPAEEAADDSTPPAEPAQPMQSAQPTQPAELAQPAPPTPATAPADLPFSAADAVRILIAIWTKVRPDQMGEADTIETLVEGVSSRRNQLLLDLSAECGIGAIDGAADTPIPALCAAVEGLAHGYRPFGQVLSSSIDDALRRLVGPTGAKPSAIADRVRTVWQLGDGWVQHVTAAIVMGAREGSSVRGGDLAVLTPAAPGSAAELDELIDAAVQHVAAEHGVSVALPSTSDAGSGLVDSAAVAELAERVVGPHGVLAETARSLLRALGVADRLSIEDRDDASDLLDLVSTELGSEWPRLVAPAFDARRAVLFDDAWAHAREAVSRVAAGLSPMESVDVRAAGEDVAAHAEFLGLPELAVQARDGGELPWEGEVAVVTGAAAGSIAGAVVAELLRGGATVVASTSSLSASKLAFFRELYASHARGHAALWVAPANLSSFADVDAFVDWLGSEQTVTVGAETRVEKPALTPTVLFPFAAPPVHGTLDDAGPHSESQMRVLLWSVERLIARLSRIGENTRVGHRLHVVLPGSPNRGRFGGDGAYGESKAALDALATRWHAEPWGRRTTLAHAHIGWVRGTGLMARNDGLVQRVEELGVRTYSPEDIARLLLDAADLDARQACLAEPLVVNLTGGLDEADLNLAELAREMEHHRPTSTPAPASTRTIRALPSPRSPMERTRPAWREVSQPLEDLVVIVGAGELGPWGSSRTRWEVELGEQLSAAGVIELAWSMGLIRWESGRWVTASGEALAEEDIAERFHDEVMARCGIRRFHDDFHMVDNLAPELSTTYLEHEISFTVPDGETARTYADSDPDHTTICPIDDGAGWRVTRSAGAPVFVPRRVRMTRFVGGQIPEGFDPAVYGIPADMLDHLDRLALWNLVCTVEAFLAAGFSPAELLGAVHPARVSSTQGTGMGGVESMRSLYIDGLLAQPRPNDILQEALPNVVAAHVMQSYVGGYGQMIHPVAACATAAVSIEEGVDKIRLGKADVVVAGGVDDLSIEGITGFGDMAATADSAALEARGIEHRRFSRANDRRRAGFVESEGGGTVLLARGSTALELGLPVHAVVAFAESFADGAHTSIPAPGLGALSAACGGSESRLARQLAAVGVAADDIAVLSKHDTSTHANDPNESDLHERIAAALGRSDGNPLYVISQKTLTGHAKGGAAAFQIAGLLSVLRSGLVPPNRSLDCVDPALRRHPHLVWLREALDLSACPPKAALLTSLGFGHVSALLALVHPEAFHAAVTAQHGRDVADAWLRAAHAREEEGLRRLTEGMHGAPLYRRPTERNLGATGEAAKEREAAVLLDPAARLVDGVLTPGAARPASAERRS